jgi:hypothetical protein
MVLQASVFSWGLEADLSRHGQFCWKQVIVRQKGLNYYVFQGTEEDWDPYLLSPCGHGDGIALSSIKMIMDRNVAHQIKELAWLSTHAPTMTSQICPARLRKYIETRVQEYEAWSSELFCKKAEGNSYNLDGVPGDGDCVFRDAVGRIAAVDNHANLGTWVGVAKGLDTTSVMIGETRCGFELDRE